MMWASNMRLIVMAILGVLLLSYGYSRFVLPEIEREGGGIQPTQSSMIVWEDVG